MLHRLTEDTYQYSYTDDEGVEVTCVVEFEPEDTTQGFWCKANVVLWNVYRDGVDVVKQLDSFQTKAIEAEALKAIKEGI